MMFNLRAFLQLSVAIIFVASAFTTGFNCSASKMHSMGSSGNESVSTSKAENLPYALLNAEQALSSMLNVTEQPQANTAVRNEFTIRNSAFSVNSYLSSMNAPMLLSATSLAGEVCNSLIARERPLAANQRLFFQSVDFNGGPAQITGTQYASVVSVFSQKVWGRTIASEESDFFNQYYTDFMATLTTAERTQAAKTSAFYLSVCSAVLSSFDSLTF
ncbi:hypothetical protein K2X05_01880 [bacterium]|nr:hypothetical protein [bacterium]